MSRVLGAHQGLGAITLYANPAPSPAPDPARAEIKRLGEALVEAQDRIRLLEREASGAQGRLDAGREEGRVQGRKEGAEQAARLEDERLSLLATTLEEATQLFRQSLQTLEPLAVDLALAALERIAGDPSFQAELVVATIRHNLAALDRGARARIVVSTADFPDEAVLVELGRLHDVEISADAGLPQGGCRIRPSLGELHLDIRDQAERLRRAIVNAHDTAS